jgi:hypothetical protein
VATAGSTSLRRRSVAVALAALLAGLMAACAAPNEDLSTALEQTRAGVRTVQLALDSLAREQTTSALAQVAASDAAEEITSAQRQAGEVQARTDDERAARAGTLAAINTSRTVVLDAADVIAEGGDLEQVGQHLEAADADLAEALSALGTR